jgi:hypothetical protein
MSARWFVLAALAACGGSKPDPVERIPIHPTTPVVSDGAAAQAQLGNSVDVKGTAGNAKLGAVITSGDLVVYCDRLPQWSAELDGKPVTGHGVLEHRADAKAQQGPNGEISQGTNGPIWVLRNCTVN